MLSDIKRDSDLHCMGSHVFKQLQSYEHFSLNILEELTLSLSESGVK